jgi:hypothetical protein
LNLPIIAKNALRELDQNSNFLTSLLKWKFQSPVLKKEPMVDNGEADTNLDQTEEVSEDEGKKYL